MNKLYVYLISFSLLVCCMSSELVGNWKNPDITNFEAKKVLLIGMTFDSEEHKLFEDILDYELKKNGVNGVKSIDFFEKSFTASPKTIEELKKIKHQLIEDKFEAILLSKVKGVDSKITLKQAYRNLNSLFRSFADDYYANQDIYYKEDYNEEYKIYHAETTLYCICPDEDHDLIWKGAIDITESENNKKVIKDYIKMLIWTLKKQRLLIIEDQINENTCL